MTNTRWRMNRAGLLNFWYYDEEVFHFAEGKLLLRGSNGSGKSVTMQSFLPVLLDGKKSPDRLDPFGSKARKMEDYLLGEKEVVDRDERTGYLFLEYRKSGTNQYMTTGIGMQAKRGKALKSWYFLITDNRRIGHDFHLMQTLGGEKIPFSAKELENRIGHGGYLVHSQREYMELVNKYVFGFQAIEAYEDLIKLLIQLRSPKLSKDFKPTVIYEILESALPPLTDDELRHLSDTIESMDQAEQQLEQLEREYNSILKVESAYDTYNKYVLAERANQWKRALQREKTAEKKVEDFSREVDELGKEIVRLRAEEERFTQQRTVAEEEKRLLSKHEVWSLEEEKEKKRNEAAMLSSEIQSLENKWSDKNKKLSAEWQEKEKTESELSQFEQQAEELLEELSIDGEESAFHQHEINVKDYERAYDGEFDFTVWIKEAKEHQNLLLSLEKKAEEAKRLATENERLQFESSERKRKVDECQKELEHLQIWFDEEQQKLESKVFLWMEEHPSLVYSSSLKQGIARSLQGLYERNRYDEVRDKLLSAIHTYEAEIKTEISMTKKNISSKQEEIHETEEELHRIKTQKMIEPERAEGTKLHREKLTEEGQGFCPFYAAVEFREHVTEEQKERLESALKKVGILDSLITNQPISPVQDSILSPEPQLLGFTLADYLMPDLDDDSPISNETVDEVLRSIPLEKEEGGYHVDVNGSYSIGCLIGHAPDEGPAKFIGRTSRKRHQREQIELWTEKLFLLQRELEALNEQQLELEKKYEEAEGWKRELPSDQELLELNEQIQRKRQELFREQELLRTIDEQWKIVYEEWNVIKKQLREAGSNLNIPLTIEEIRKALNASGSYLDFLHQFQITSVRITSSKSKLSAIRARIQELEEELDSLKGEQNSKSAQLQQVNVLIQSIEQQLELKGIDEVRRRIQEVQALLNEADSQLRGIMESLPRKETAQQNSNEKLKDAKQEYFFWKNMSAEWAKMVEKEVERKFVLVESSEPAEIFSQYEAVYDKYDRAKLLEQLSKVFFNEQTDLTEYRMFEYAEDTEIPEWFHEEIADHFESYKNEWHQLKGRRIIQLEYRGQKVSPYYVSAALKKEIEDQRSWLDEQDRQLYEDIILNTVGNILRTRIQRAQSWVKEMDKIMAERDNSSGLIFSIAWKPLTAESEVELDTIELVKLLQRNSKFLSEEDLERITKHFQSRIAKAKELIELRNEGTTLHQVLKEVLDYRKWFTFVLSYSRVNEPKRELTNNAFFKFSGGEKAMAMYIPLFTAAYSRYREAGDMAPYIISLDEAFAGVDENNIRDMFEVVEQLGFNYIMNSQALWGDYDTVSSLSICELVRPKNADYVTVIRYEWDGKQKTLVFDEVEELVHHE